MASVSTKMEEKKSEFKGKKFRVAIIGCGGIAQAHLNAYKEIPEVEIVAGVDIVADRLVKMSDTWGVPEECLFGADIKTGKTTSETAWREMLKKVKPDAVDVCTPNGLHCQPVVDSCNAGCHAIVEKPMAMNPAECEKMIAAAEKHNVIPRSPFLPPVNEKLPGTLASQDTRPKMAFIEKGKT